MLQRLRDRQRTSRQPGRERFPLEMFHHEVVDLSLVTDIVQGADIRVIQRSDRTRLPLEPLPCTGIDRGLLKQDLDRDDAIEASISGPVDFSHSARSDASR